MRIIYWLIGAALAGCLGGQPGDTDSVKFEKTPPPAEPERTPENDDTLQYAQNALKLADPKLSDTRRTLLPGMLAGIADQIFVLPEHRAYWLALIGTESGYNGRARSATGAVGLGQLIVRYRADFGKDCGLTDATPEDVADDYTNAYLSACYFRSLLVRHEGNIPLALVSYNQGMFSKDAARAAKGSSVSLEPANHVTKTLIIKTQITK